MKTLLLLNPACGKRHANNNNIAITMVPFRTLLPVACAGNQRPGLLLLYMHNYGGTSETPDTAVRYRSRTPFLEVPCLIRLYENSK